MLIKFTALTAHNVHTRDKEIGKVKDVLFDDGSWTVRYLVVDTRKWLPGKRVLVSPQAVEPILPETPLLVNLTRDQIERCPGEETDEPISRQYEHELHQFYGWTPYWASGITGISHPYGPYVHGKFGDAVPVGIADILRERGGPHKSSLRSCREVRGYEMANTEGDIGSVTDFFVNSQTWEVVFLVVDTGDWLPGKKVVVPHHVINKVSWADRQVMVVVPRDVVKTSIEAATVEAAPSKDHGVMEHFFGYFLKEPEEGEELPQRQGNLGVGM